MSFKAQKKEDYTLISFENNEKNRYQLFLVFLTAQIITLIGLVFYFPSFKNFFIGSIIVAIVLVLLFLYFNLRKKNLKLSKEHLVCEYKLFGLTTYKKTIKWQKLTKVAVEFTRLKTHDIIFQIGKKTIYLGESLNEENSDSLLKEIQLFHHYYLGHS